MLQVETKNNLYRYCSFHMLVGKPRRA